MINLFLLMVDIGTMYGIFLILASSMELEYGELGIPNFGKVMFFAAGAFTVGALAVRIGTWLAGITWEGEFKTKSILYSTLVSRYFASHPLDAIAVFLFTLFLASIMGAVLGIVASYPAIRLREDYLAITLIAAGELFRIFGRNYDPLIGGTMGVGVPDVLAWLPSGAKEAGYILLSLSFAAATWLILYRLSTSPYGRTLRAIRDEELAASTLGKDIVKYRMRVLALGSAMAAVAGVIYAFYMGSVLADDFNPLKTFLVVLMVVLGGSGNPFGTLVGVAVYILLDRTLAILKHYVVLPFDINYFAMFLFGVLLLLVLMYKPEGIIPERPLLTVRAKFCRREDGTPERKLCD